MRSALTLAFAVLIGSIGASVLAAGTTGSLAGRVVDPSGRAVTAQPIELVSGFAVVNTTVTTQSGSWLFRDVPAGDYVVRITLRGTVTGIRATVAPGDAIDGQLIVTPAAAAAPQVGAVAGILAGSGSSALVSAAAVAVTAATAGTQSTDTVQADPLAIFKALEAATPAERQAFAQELLAVVSGADNPLASGDQQDALKDALNEIIKNPDATPVLPGNISGT
jgi:hypothetical protein